MNKKIPLTILILRHEICTAGKKQHVAAIWREDRLMAAGDIDDAQAAHAEAEIALGQGAAVVRAAVDDPVALLHDDFGCDRAPGASVPSRDATHDDRS